MVTVCPSQFATRRTLFHVLVGCGLLMLKVSRLKLPVIWLLVSMWLNTLTKIQIWTFLLSSRRRHTRLVSDWSSDVCSSDLQGRAEAAGHSARVSAIRQERRVGEQRAAAL